MQEESVAHLLFTFCGPLLLYVPDLYKRLSAPLLYGNNSLRLWSGTMGRKSTKSLANYVIFFLQVENTEYLYNSWQNLTQSFEYTTEKQALTYTIS